MEFFIIDHNGQQAGPFSFDQLVQKGISPETLVWKQGMADWTPAWKVEDLRAVLEAVEANQNNQNTQKQEANQAFGKFIKKNYLGWMQDSEKRPEMSPDLFKQRVFPMLDNEEKVFFILIDNFRLDQWRVVKELLADYYTYDESLYYSILPTATQYARNAIFSGLMPQQIAKMFPELWVDEDSEEGKNLNEAPLIQTQIERFRKKYSFSYTKVYDSEHGEKLISSLPQLLHNQLNVVVLNFVDNFSPWR